MKIKVCKFGGTSLACAGNIQNVKNIILKQQARKIIVVSAPGKRNPCGAKITDLLYAVARGDGDFNIIAERFDAIVSGLNLSINLKPEYDEIKEKIKAGAGADYAASRGEYLMAKIMAQYLGFEFVDSAKIIEFDANGIFLVNKTELNIKKTLDGLFSANIKGVVIPGFYGAYPSGAIKTFSRGGSDITGSIVAASMGIKIYENWTDVNGVYGSDPNKSAEPIKPYVKISYDKMLELARNGAVVVHPYAVSEAQKAGIKIIVKNTFNPTARGTVIY